MKTLTYEDWIKNPTPRMMWVWDDDEKEKAKRKVVYVTKEGSHYYPVRATAYDDTTYEAYKHCAEIEASKTRRMTNKELSRWLREGQTRECKYLNNGRSNNANFVFCYHTYFESDADEVVDDTILIREDDSEWREPLIEEEEHNGTSSITNKKVQFC